MAKGAKNSIRKAMDREQETKRVIKEVLEAMKLHHTVIENNLNLHCRVCLSELKDIELGMQISITKLECLLKGE